MYIALAAFRSVYAVSQMLVDDVNSSASLTIDFPETNIDEFIIEDGVLWGYKVDIKGFNSVSKKLSSGQSILLYIITEIVANIRYDSLIIYDEPETHLHPNAISQLINTIYELTNEFQSYCIIATHSPLIVRELLSRNVYVVEREGNIISLRKPLIETFGENLTTITEEIFGNRDIPNQYEKILNRLAQTGKSFDEILSIIESENITLSLILEKPLLSQLQVKLKLLMEKPT